FDERERAERGLEDLGELAEPALRKALQGTTSAEVRRRLTGLLAKLGGATVAPEPARGLRCVEALEHIGSQEARRALGQMAQGAPEARLTREAKASLQRLAKRAALTR